MQRELWYTEAAVAEDAPFAEDPDPGHAHNCPAHGVWWHQDLRCPQVWDAQCPDENVEVLFPLGVRR